VPAAFSGSSSTSQKSAAGRPAEPAKKAEPGRSG